MPPPRLTSPLRKLKQYETRAAADILRELKATRRRVQDDIRRTTAEAEASTDARERERLYAKIKGHYKQLSDGIEKHIAELTGKAARTAHDEVKEESGGKLATRYDPDRTARYFKTLHPANGKNIAAVFTQKMADTDIRALRGAVIEAFRKQSVEGLTASETSRLLRDRWNELATTVNDRMFTDKGGRPWENARYIQMLTRTTAQRVHNEATIDSLAQGGELARVSSDGDPDCKICAAWEGRILRIRGKGLDFPTYEDARAAGMFHPNCVHKLEYVDETDDAADIARQRGLGRPDAARIKDRAFMQGQKDIIDAGAYIDKGLSPGEARTEVLRDRLRAAIGGGTFSESAFKAADKLTAAELEDLHRRGIFRFEQVKGGEAEGIRGGVVRVPRKPTGDDILRVLGLPADNREDLRVEIPEPPKPPPAFPDDPDGLKVIGGLGGSTGAELVEDEYGQQFVRKRGGGAGGDAAGHLRSEVAADEAYIALGVNVPECRLYEADSGPVKLSKFIPDAQPLGDWLEDATASDRDQVLAEIRKDFDVDVVFGNRDVVGASGDNILVDKNGKPWRIDNGAAFGWRAQGARKSDWTKWPDELNTMRAEPINKGVFDKASVVDTVIRSTGRDWDGIAKMVPAQDREMFRERVKEMLQLGHRAEGFKSTGYIETYNEGVLQHSYALSKEGFREEVPQKVEDGEFGNFRSSKRVPTSASTGPGGMPSNWKDIIISAAKTVNHHAKDNTEPNQSTLAKAEALKPALEKLVKAKTKGASYWLSSLNNIQNAAQEKGQTVGMIDTGKDIIASAKASVKPEHQSLTDHAHNYIKRIGGDVSLVTNWQSDQARSSWRVDACLRKVIQDNVRPMADADSFFGKPGTDANRYAEAKAELASDKNLAKKATDTFAAYDAAVQLALENCEFKNNDITGKTVTLIRTEEMDNLKKYGITEKDKNGLINFKRGACESHSIFREVEVKGDTTTLVSVKFSLVKGMYFFERNPGSGDGCFLGDHENEFTVDTRGCPTMLVGPSKAQRIPDLTIYQTFGKLASQLRS